MRMSREEDNWFTLLLLDFNLHVGIGKLENQLVLFCCESLAPSLEWMIDQSRVSKKGEKKQ